MQTYGNGVRPSIQGLCNVLDGLLFAIIAFHQLTLIRSQFFQAMLEGAETLFGSFSLVHLFLVNCLKGAVFLKNQAVPRDFLSRCPDLIEGHLERPGKKLALRIVFVRQQPEFAIGFLERVVGLLGISRQGVDVGKEPSLGGGQKLDVTAGCFC